MACFFFQAEDGIRDLVRSRGLGDVYKRQMVNAVANSTVPKFSIVMGNSYGAGNYAMCGKAYDLSLIHI